MGLDIDPHRLASTLSVGQQQIIEIVKAMSFNPKILLLDEPTSALADPRGRAALRPGSQAPRARRHDDLHHPPHERAVRDRRHLHGAPRRRACRLHRDARRHARPHRRHDVRRRRQCEAPAARSPSTAAARRPSRSPDSARDRRFLRHFVRASIPARSSGSPASWARGGRKCCGRSSAPIRSMPEPSRSAAA